MGVHSGANFIAEHHADDGGITTTDGKQAHSDGQAPKIQLNDNYALPRAILKGSQPKPVSLSSLVSGGVPRRV